MLRQLAEIHLQETDTAFVGKLRAVDIEPQSGDLLITDGFSERVLRFGRNGEFRALYGRRGGGPGELESAGIVFTNGSFVAVDDNGRRQFVVFDEETGEYLRTIPYTGRVNAVTPLEDRWLAGAFNIQTGQVLATFDLSGDTGFEYQWLLADEYMRSNPLSGVFNIIPVASDDTDVYFGYCGLNRLYSINLDQGVVDSVVIPAKHRVGTPTDLVHMLDNMTDFPSIYSAASCMFYIQVVDKRTLAVYHYDMKWAQDLAAAEVHGSLLDRSTLKPICVDFPVHVESATPPAMAFRADTVFLTTQEVTGTEANVVVRIATVDRAACLTCCSVQ